MEFILSGWNVVFSERPPTVAGSTPVTNITAKRGDCVASITAAFDEWSISVMQGRRYTNNERLSYRAARRELCQSTGLDLRRIFAAADDAMFASSDGAQ
jgi:hypothetical protein